METLVRENLVSKAMASATRPAATAAGDGVHAALQRLFPEGTPAALNGQAPQAPDQDTLQRLTASVSRQIGRSPRRSGHGPNGSRFEHWRTLLCDGAAREACAQVVVLFLFGQLSEEAMAANLGARLIALRKPNGGLRPIACGCVLRRLAGRAACEIFGEGIKRGCGRFQYAVGRRAGCEVVHKTLAALTEGLPQGVVLAFDAANGFNS